MRLLFLKSLLAPTCLTLLILVGEAAYATGQPSSFVYAGRLTEPSGQPLVGPLNLSAQFSLDRASRRHK